MITGQGRIYDYMLQFPEQTIELKRFFAQIEDVLEQSGLIDSYRTAVWIFCDVLSCSPAYLIAHGNLYLNHDQITKIQKMTERCANHEPVQYVTGHTEFHGLHLHLTPEVLIPRLETEQLVEISLEVAKKIRVRRVLDIGTGSGCIALAMKQAFPEADVTACDISQIALDITKINADKNKLKLRLVPADLFMENFISEVGSRYDLVIANPPYIPDREHSDLPRMVRDYEPAIALLCGEDPLKFYRAIIKHLDLGLLHPSGVLALEVHADYADSVATLLRKQKFVQVQMRRDLAGMPRFVIAESCGESSSAQK